MYGRQLYEYLPRRKHGLTGIKGSVPLVAEVCHASLTLIHSSLCALPLGFLGAEDCQVNSIQKAPSPPVRPTGNLHAATKRNILPMIRLPKVILHRIMRRCRARETIKKDNDETNEMSNSVLLCIWINTVHSCIIRQSTYAWINAIFIKLFFSCIVIQILHCPRPPPRRGQASFFYHHLLAAEIYD